MRFLWEFFLLQGDLTHRARRAQWKNRGSLRLCAKLHWRCAIRSGDIGLHNHVALPRDCEDRYPRCGWRTSSVTLRKGATIRDSSTVLSVPCVLNLLVEERIPIKIAFRTGRGLRSERCKPCRGVGVK